MHSRSLNGCRSAPSTRTSVSPVVAPLAGLRLVTVSGVKYTNFTSLRLNCCPFIVISTLTRPALSCGGDVHVKLPKASCTERTSSEPNLQR